MQVGRVMLWLSWMELVKVMQAQLVIDSYGEVRTGKTKQA